MRVALTCGASLLALTMGGTRADEAPAPPEPLEQPAAPDSLPPLPAITPPTLATVDAAITRGVDHLISSQNANGSWGGATQTKGLNIYAPLPGAHHAFRTGSSALALYGLLKSGDARPETLATIDRAEAWMIKQLPRLRRADFTTTYNVWGHAYGLRALSALHQHRAGDDAKQSILKNLAIQQLEMLERYEDVNGGWGYLDFEGFTQKPSGLPTSFTTATVLVGMHEAREVLGVKLPETEVQRSLRSIRQQQTPDHAYVYSFNHRYRPRVYINRPGGSLGRSQACSAALRYFGDDTITDEILKTWLDRLILRNGWLDIARKRPVPHETHFSNSGYFYYYGHFYAMDCIGFLPETDRSVYYQHISRILLGKQEKDGSWWDYPLYSYHKPYGTGYVLATLASCRAGLE